MNEDIRETFHSEEYDQYYNSLDEKIIARQIMNKYTEEDKDNDEV